MTSRQFGSWKQVPAVVAGGGRVLGTQDARQQYFMYFRT